VVPAAGLPISITWEDARGRKLDVHPVDLEASPFGGPNAALAPFGTGTIAGRQVPCLSADLQLGFRRGYRHADADDHDVALLSPGSAPERPGRGSRRTALIIPLAAAEEPLSRLYAGPAERHALPAHVTVLYPFAPARMIDAPMLDDLRRLAERVPGFELTLAEVARFPGVLYLRPEPERPFVELTQLVAERWPHYPPYAGRHDGDPVPHVTVVEGPEPAGMADTLQALLPIRAVADELWLVEPRRSSGWRIRERLRLGAG
jgi:hypothetical protein